MIVARSDRARGTQIAPAARSSSTPSSERTACNGGSSVGNVSLRLRVTMRPGRNAGN
jgi:hypothetical protein